MSDDWRENDGRNVYQMVSDAGGPGIWVRRTNWEATIAHVVGMSELAGPPPYFGSPKVVMDVYSMQGKRKDDLARLDTAGTYKTWRQVTPPIGLLARPSGTWTIRRLREHSKHVAEKPEPATSHASS